MNKDRGFPGLDWSASFGLPEPPSEFWRQARAELERRGVRGTGPKLDLAWGGWAVELARGDGLVGVAPGGSFEGMQRAVGVNTLRTMLNANADWFYGPGGPQLTQEQAEALYDAMQSRGGDE